ncbi:MAG TPA: hypothetical protein VNI77_03130 [Nitrososphaera sp.]|nr:hypothetical protein [Nitrososphaera sp.]
MAAGVLCDSGDIPVDISGNDTTRAVGTAEKNDDVVQRRRGRCLR